MNDVPCVLFTVANKVAFMEAGAVPAMMRLMDRGPNDPITAIALDAVTILAEDNDEVDEAVARTGVSTQGGGDDLQPGKPKVDQRGGDRRHAHGPGLHGRQADAHHRGGDTQA